MDTVTFVFALMALVFIFDLQSKNSKLTRRLKELEQKVEELEQRKK